MKEKIKNLLELQKLDMTIQGIRDNLKEVPEKLSELNSKMNTDEEKINNLKNEMIKKSYLFNPVSFFQNHINTISNTHYDDYQSYRDKIQNSIDKQIEMLVLDTWMDKKVDKERFMKYHRIFSIQ